MALNLEYIRDHTSNEKFRRNAERSIERRKQEAERAPSPPKSSFTPNYSSSGRRDRDRDRDTKKTSDPYNEILYSKQLFERADNDGKRAWASQNAQQYYSQLDPGEADRVRNMNAQQLQDYLKTRNSSPASNMAPPSNWRENQQQFGGMPNNAFDMEEMMKMRQQREAEIRQQITKQYQNDLVNQIAAINQQIAKAMHASRQAIGEERDFLDRQIDELSKQKTIAESNAQTLQNRRGGFYSGGLDYRLGNIDRSTAEAEGNLRSESSQRVGAIRDRNDELAESAAANIARLQQQAPGRIRGLINEAIDRQRAMDIQEAGVTGFYQGMPTMAAQNQAFNQNLALGEFGLKQDQQQLNQQNQLFNQILQLKEYDLAANKFDLDKTQIYAALTGFMPDGRPTNEFQQKSLDRAWQTINALGYVPPELAKVVGIPAGTPTQEAVEFSVTSAISQQNANTSAYSAKTSRMNANNSISNQNVDTLMEVWRNSGVAPEGLEGYGIQPGTPYFDPVAARQENQPSEPTKLDGKTSANNADFLRSEIQAQLRQGVAKDQLKAYLKSQAVELSDSDYKKLLEYINEYDPDLDIE